MRALAMAASAAMVVGCAGGPQMERATLGVSMTGLQEVPGPGSFFGVDDRIKLFATVDNFLNLLDSSWNLQHRRDFAARQDIAALKTSSSNFALNGVDLQGRYIIGPSAANAGIAAFDSDNFVNVSSSVWRLKVGISYEF